MPAFISSRILNVLFIICAFPLILLMYASVSFMLSDSMVISHLNESYQLKQYFSKYKYSAVHLYHYFWVYEWTVISEPCYKETILQKNYRKMTIIWSFSYNSIVKFHGKTICEPLHDHVISKPVL